MRVLIFSALAALWGLGTSTVAAQASVYLPADHWAVHYIEHLIRRGAMVDPAPLSRPLRSADLVRALRAVDSLASGAVEWNLAQRIIRDLERREQGPFGRLEGHLALSAATHPLRDPLETRCRPTDTGCTERDVQDTRGYINGGLGLELLFGPVVAVTRPYFDTRLKYDPDYRGKKDRAVAGRNAEAYASGQWGFGSAFFGALPRNWGPSALQGLVVSPAPYSYDHLAVEIGTTGLRIEGIVTQLDDLRDTAGTPHHRYLVAHRIVIRPPGRTTIALSEGSLVAGEGRELEPWYLNILNVGLLASYDQNLRANHMFGLDVDTRVGRTRLFGTVLIDDIQIDDERQSDQEPPLYGFSLGASLPVGPASLTAYYTRASNLVYRTIQVTETYVRRGVGLARNFTDYDQLTLEGSALVGTRLLLRPEITLLRQGEGDMLRPYPPIAAYDTTPSFLAGTVERTLRLALRADFTAGPLRLAADAGMHLISDHQHVSGADDSQFVGSVSLSYRFRYESVLP
jgi:hypothetical protein